MAGIIPFSYWNNEVYFLFHKTFIGKKVETLIDFGGS